jgi:hypothetical protein
MELWDRFLRPADGEANTVCFRLASSSGIRMERLSKTAKTWFTSLLLRTAWIRSARSRWLPWQRSHCYVRRVGGEWWRDIVTGSCFFISGRRSPIATGARHQAVRMAVRDLMSKVMRTAGGNTQKRAVWQKYAISHPDIRVIHGSIWAFISTAVILCAGVSVYKTESRSKTVFRNKFL